VRLQNVYRSLRKPAGPTSSNGCVITTIATPRRLRLAGFAAGAVVLAGAAVYVTASAAGYNLSLKGSPSASTQTALASTPDKVGTASAACTDFKAHFASDLGTSQTKIDAAYQQAVTQTLADEVKNGTLTQAQADKIRQRLTGGAPCALPAGLGTNAGGAQYTQALMAAAASALGITPQQLKTDLAGGMSLSQIAAAQKPPITEDQFRTKLIADIKPLLDKAVAGQKMTSAQEQQILQRLQTGPIPYWAKP
jgi:hypothetical protein